MYEFLFLADCQLGMYATFSGMTEADVAEFAERGMRVELAMPREDVSPHEEGGPPRGGLRVPLVLMALRVAAAAWGAPALAWRTRT